MSQHIAKQVLILALAGAALLAMAGCSPSFNVPPLPGFVQLPDQEQYDYRSTSANGVVVAVRELKHKPKGDEGFWVQAVKNQMRALGGYALLETAPVTTKSGLKGTQLRFGHDEPGATMLYQVTIFVTDKKIYLVEFGGPKAEMTRLSGQLAWLLDNFQLT